MSGLILLASAPTALAAEAFDLESHRGGRGLRPENTLASFGHSLRLGVTTLELDTGVTKDGVVVVSHERRISTLECSGPHVGKLVKDLTLKQIKQLDCGTRRPPVPSTDEFLPTQEAVPGTKMPTLAEVFELANRYGAKGVQFNIETKIDPTPANKNDTIAPGPFARKVIAEIKKYKMTKRSLIQSFDWRTLVEARRVAPSLRRVALAQADTIKKGTPWTAGIKIGNNPFGDGSLALAVADELKADVLSPRYQDITDRLIKSAHNRGLTVIPWTVNQKADMKTLIKRDVDGIITDYPDRLREVMDAEGLDLPDPIASPFDVEAHRGGRRYRPENTLAAFTYGLSRDVDTLELDTAVTKDGVVVVAHDRSINPNHCQGDAALLGQPISQLTFAQIRTLDCGSKGDFAGQPGWVASPGEKMPTLQEVFDLVAAKGDTDVRFNIETKISPTVDDTVPYDVFTAKVVKLIQDNNLRSRAMIQSFDWRTIRLSKQLDPQIETVALVWQYAGADCDDISDECSLQAVIGDPSVISPWTGGLDWWRYKDLGKLVNAAKADVVSSNWQVHDPTQGKVNNADYYLKEDPAIYHGPPVPTLQDKGLRVVPYTINDQPTMQRVIDLGVDGIISDDPDALLLVAKRNGLR
ncbi:glycerophosphodiester phosphodiesterase family protein [Solirubrobacter phytolaccae]|uniref:Glycerophosphodiester phosphodiesterase family protein n=1 Tax=Solirubrobacter phytolaccae TaxID=1404360 RepID=A0A9X3NF51_9ACTN|nr:glycerophosphodiester phosphodiesterase family protein [Solirubrobacter phytolaccae]MDA0185515.1 glycerophosphodiester phosphodiesterase family protein [Solirubrobacter phytolaccae]